jgi:hypothetical protein
MTGTGSLEDGKKAEIEQEANSTAPKLNICCNCLELYKRLDVINERLHIAGERERALLKENNELKAKNTELEHKLSLFAPGEESKENTA